MDERTLRCIVERGDTDALEMYIRHDRTPLSQPLDAEARFAYYHLSHDARGENVARLYPSAEKKVSSALREDYCGPPTTVILCSQRKEAAVIRNPGSHAWSTASPYHHTLHGQPNFGEFPFIEDDNKWTSDILRRSSPFYSIREARDAFYQLRGAATKSPCKSPPRVKMEQSPSVVVPLETVVKVASASQHAHLSPLSQTREVTFRQKLQDLEAAEARERLKIETSFEELVIEDYRSFNLLLDRCAKKKRDFLMAEFIARSKIQEMERHQFNEIIGICLDDVTGCRWDGVRMQWARTLMANALVLHEWVVLNSLVSSRRHDDGVYADAVKTRPRFADKVNEHRKYGWRGDGLLHSTATHNEAPLSHDFADNDSCHDCSVELRGTALDRHRHQMSARPSRPRVLPPVSPHEECTMC